MPPETPSEWLPVLTKRLDNRRPRIDMLRSYANGNAPLPEMRENLRASWEAFQKKARTNLGGLAVESLSSCIIPNGLQIGDEHDSPVTDTAHRILRDNRWNSQIRDVIRDYLTCGIGYILVGEDQGKAVITRERPEQAIAAVDPVRPWKARAFLKVWRDEDEGFDYATVRAGARYQQFSRESVDRFGKLVRLSSGDWQPVGDERLFSEGPSVVVLERPEGVGLFEPHVDVIDRINVGKLQRLVITAMQAFRQRALKPNDSNSGGLPSEDSDGNAIDWEAILEPAPGALWDLPVPVDIWESQSTDVRPLLDAEKEDAKSFAALTRTPVFMLIPDGANQSASGAESADRGQVLQAKEEIDRIAPDLAVAVVYALRIESVDLGDATVKVLFESPEHVSITEKFAAAVQARSAGQSTRTIKRDILGMSPEQIRQDESDLAAEKLSDLFTVDDEPSPQEPPPQGSSRSDAIPT